VAEVRELVRLGADGIFGDFPDVVVEGVRGARRGAAR
jgi:glycerophosphoryl diester phosphodiesterase